MTNITKDERRNFVGASEVSALFGVHPQITLFELWHRKAGNLEEPDLSDVERIFWGQTLEPAIAKGIAEQENWKIRNVRRYITHPTIGGMGASLDFEVLKDKHGSGVLEIKNVDRLIYRNWPEGEAPLYFQLQVQHQLSVSRKAWGAVGALVGGNEPVVFKMDRHEGAIKKIEQAVEAFWLSIKEGQEPSPDFSQDQDAIGELYGSSTPGKFLDMTGEDHFEELCRTYDEARAAERFEKSRKDTAKAEILTLSEEAEQIRCEPYTINRKNNFRLFKISRNEELDTLSSPPTPDLPATRIRTSPPLGKQASIF